MKQVLLTRDMKGDRAYLGNLKVDGEPISYTVENVDKLFSVGVYLLRLTRTGQTMPKEYKGQAYEICDVEGRTHIKIHVLNRPSQSEGCCGPNMRVYFDTESGGVSTEATRRFMQAMEEDGELVQEATITVREV